MPRSDRSRLTAAAAVLLIAAPLVRAQVAKPNAAAVSMSHVHLIVPEMDRHLRIWTLLGGDARWAGERRLLAFPRVYVVLSEGTPAAPSSETAINHLGFSVRDYADYKAKVQSVGATFVFDSAENGQMIVDLPGGVNSSSLPTASNHRPSSSITHTCQPSMVRHCAIGT